MGIEYFPKVRTPGVACAHKAEMVSNNVGTTLERIYFIPIIVKAITTFNEYNFDIVLAGGGTITVQAAIYEQFSNITSSGVLARLVPNTTATLVTAASFQTIALGSNFTLLPGSYWIAFQWTLTSGGITVSSPNAIRVGNWFKQRWVYYTPASFAFPNALLGIGAGGVAMTGYTESLEYPFWGAIRYTGDAYP